MHNQEHFTVLSLPSKDLISFLLLLLKVHCIKEGGVKKELGITKQTLLNCGLRP
jgi:hypothetical protein